MEDLSVQQNNQYVEVINSKESEKKLYEMVKRMLDVFFAIIGFIISAPVILLTCVAVRIESKGKAIFKQERTGKDGQVFYLYKIRSMHIDAEENGPKWASKNDSRVTRIGKFIRKTRLDELPQLINILKGEMSIIGPRPEREIFIREFEKDIPNFRYRLKIKPGLTGLAQVSGGYDISPREKLKFDLIYIERRNFMLDFIIVIRTIAIVLTGYGAR